MFPSFHSPFLQDCCRAFAARSQALSHHGTLTHATGGDGEAEWLTIKYTPLVGPYLILQLGEDRRLSLYLRSRKRHNRGKVLCAMEEIAVVGDGPAVVERFEWTVEQVSGFDDGAEDPDRSDAIRAGWDRVRLRLHDP